MKHNHVTKKCKRCGCLTVIGVSGNWLLMDALCDKCSGVIRDNNGDTWMSFEDMQKVRNANNHNDMFTLTRAEAFHVPS